MAACVKKHHQAAGQVQHGSAVARHTAPALQARTRSRAMQAFAGQKRRKAAARQDLRRTHMDSSGR